MTRKLLGIFTSITAALLVVSVAWAAGDAGTRVQTGAGLDVSAGAAASVAGSTPTTEADTSTSVTSGGSGSTSVTTAGSSSTSSSTTVTTTAGGSTSTSVGNTSTSVESTVTSDAGGTFEIPGVGSVRVEKQLGALILAGVSAPDWEVRIKDARSDRVRVEFRKGDAKAELEIRLRADGRLEIEIERS